MVALSDEAKLVRRSSLKSAKVDKVGRIRYSAPTSKQRIRIVEQVDIEIVKQLFLKMFH